MPYIEDEKRPKFDAVLDQMPDIPSKGDLEYCLFKLMLMYMSGKEWRFSVLSDDVYAAAHCHDEFRRRFLDVREDEARLKNGDVLVKGEPVGPGRR